MATTILIPEKDPMGAAISDFFNLHRADRFTIAKSKNSRPKNKMCH